MTHFIKKVGYCLPDSLEYSLKYIIQNDGLMKVKLNRILNVAGHISSIISTFPKFRVNVLNNVWMQRTTQRKIKVLGLFVARSLVKEMLVPDVTFSADKTKLIHRHHHHHLPVHHVMT